MQENLNPFNLISTSMAHMQTEEKNSRPPLLHTEMRTKLSPRPPFGKSDHNSILLGKLKQEAPVTRSIRKLSDEADAKLQDCFSSTDWNMFWDSSDGIEEYTNISHWVYQ